MELIGLKHLKIIYKISMNEILTELVKGSTIILETEKLPDFWIFTMSQKDYYSFRYTYSENLVSITLLGKDTIIKMHKNA